MAACATRSASGAASSSDDGSRCLLLALSHDELGVIVDGLADPLQPVVAVALSSTCKGLRTPLRAALEVLQQRHERAKALGKKTPRAGGPRMSTCADLRDAKELEWQFISLTAKDMRTLGLILPWMPRLEKLILRSTDLDAAGMQVLFDCLGRGAAPSLCYLDCSSPDGSKFGPAGAEALAAALFGGAMPKLVDLLVSDNAIGNQGVVALAPALKKLPALKFLDLGVNRIGDEGVAALLDNLGKDDFKHLAWLFLDGNELSDKGCATVVAALKAGSLPAIKELRHPGDEFSDDASAEACAAVDAALQQRLG